MSKMTKYDVKARFSLTWKKMKPEFLGFMQVSVVFIFLSVLCVLIGAVAGALAYLPFFLLGFTDVGAIIAIAVGVLVLFTTGMFAMEFSEVDPKKIEAESKRLKVIDENDVMNKNKRGSLTQAQDGKEGGVTISS